VLALRVLKRRGPPLESPLLLALPPVLSETARQRARAGLREGVPAPVSAKRAPALNGATFIDLA
jgi:protein ImuA